MEDLFDSHSDTSRSLEYPFCPNYEEMGQRFKSKARYFLGKAKKADDLVEARLYLEEAVAYSNIARKMFARHHQVMRLVKF